MESNKQPLSKDERKMLICFFAVAFGGLLLLFPYKFFVVSNGVDHGPLYRHFAALLPAAGVILGLSITRKKQKLSWFMKTYLTVVVMEMLCCIGSWIFPNSNWYNAGYDVVYIGSVIVLICMWCDGAETRRIFGLSWQVERTAVPFYIIFLFVALYLGRYFFDLWICGDFKLWYETQTDSVLIREMIMFLQLPIFFLIGFLFYFGEEYGWRYFLQPIFQKKFGMLGGTLLVGLIWGVWHTPIDWPNGGGIWVAMTTKTLYCMIVGMFFSFAYMMTKSIWVVTMIHFLHNNLPILFFNSVSESIGSAETSISFGAIALFILENLVFAIPLVVYWIYKRYHRINGR